MWTTVNGRLCEHSLRPTLDKSRVQGSGSCCWPRLDSLKISDIYDSSHSLFGQELLVKLLESCLNSLRRFVSIKSQFGSAAWLALRRHLNTLEVLHLDTASWILQEIMASCPMLRELRSGTLYVGDVADTRAAEAWRRIQTEKRIRSLNYDINEARHENNADLPENSKASGQQWPNPLSPPRPWVCRRLRVLRVKVERMEEDDSANRQVFDRFAQLRELEVINIHPGWAGRLGGFDARQYPSYLGYVKKPIVKNEDDTGGTDKIDSDDEDYDYDYDDHYFHWETRGVKQIMRLPSGSRILEIWPGMTICRLAK